MIIEEKDVLGLSTIRRNRGICGGCGTVISVGILANDSFARVQNNLVSAGACALVATPQPAYLGMRVLLANDVNEMDIDSNTIERHLAAATALSQLGLDDDAVEAPPRDLLPAHHVRCQPAVEMKGRLADWVAEIRRLRNDGDGEWNQCEWIRRIELARRVRRLHENRHHER